MNFLSLTIFEFFLHYSLSFISFHSFFASHLVSFVIYSYFAMYIFYYFQSYFILFYFCCVQYVVQFCVFMLGVCVHRNTPLMKRTTIPNPKTKNTTISGRNLKNARNSKVTTHTHVLLALELQLPPQVPALALHQECSRRVLLFPALFTSGGVKRVMRPECVNLFICPFVSVSTCMPCIYGY